MFGLVIVSLSLSLVIAILLISQKFQSKSKTDFDEEMQVLSREMLPASREFVFYLVIIIVTTVTVFSLKDAQNIKTLLTMLNRYLGLYSLILLFLTLTPGLIRVYLPNFIFNRVLLMARRSFGLSTFFFALAHGILSFYLYFGFSFSTLSNLNLSYQLAALFGATALLMFIFMALLDIPLLLKLVGFRTWKTVHRAIYLASILLVFHVFIRGSDFQNRLGLIALTFSFLFFTFVTLEIFATAIELHKKRAKRLRILSFLYYSALSGFLGLAIFILLQYYS